MSSWICEWLPQFKENVILSKNSYNCSDRMWGNDEPVDIVKPDSKGSPIETKPIHINKPGNLFLFVLFLKYLNLYITAICSKRTLPVALFSACYILVWLQLLSKFHVSCVVFFWVIFNKSTLNIVCACVLLCTILYWSEPSSLPGLACGEAVDGYYCKLTMINLRW